ncbi:MAG: DUF1080 domain-containing protein [Verrucomicrobiota bacterium]
MGLSLVSVLCAAEFGTVPDPYTGNWAGTLKSDAKEAPVHATVIAYKNRYEVTLRAEPDTRKPAIVVFNGTVQRDKLVLEQAPNPDSSGTIPGQRDEGATKAVRWSGQAKGDEMTGAFAGGEPSAFSLKKIPFQPSPTLGDKAPDGALVLFNGKHLNAWESKQASADAIQWIVAESEALEVVSQRDGKRNKQDLRTKENFGDYRLHLEFKLAYKPEATGQGRSNSGIIHLGVYETQILDSFGLYGRDNECGGIYKTREPDRNVGYPAGLWQTYDIEFKAPRFSSEGKKTADARMSVRLNGIPIHKDVAVPNPTGGGKETARGPIVLQDHGNPVQFRNIWVVKLD